MAYRLDHPTGATIRPPIPAPTATPNRFYQGGDSVAGTAATVVEAWILNMVVEEIANAVETNGGTLDKNDNTQLATLLTALTGGNFLPLTGGTVTGDVIFSGCAPIMRAAVGVGRGLGIASLGASRGTLAAPAGIAAGDALGAYVFGGHDGAGWIAPGYTSAGMTAFAPSAWTATNHATQIDVAGIAENTVETDRQGALVWNPTACQINILPRNANGSAGTGPNNGGGSPQIIYWNKSLNATPAAAYMQQGLIGTAPDFTMCWETNFGSLIDVETATGDFYVRNGAAYTALGGATWNTPSDARIKRDVADYAAGLEQVIALRPVSFFYNGAGPTEDSGDDVQYGLIAQEARESMPEMVFVMQPSQHTRAGERAAQADIPDLLGMNTGPLLFAVVNAIKELAGRVASLEGSRLGAA